MSVINLFDAKRKEKKIEETEEEIGFEDIMKQNAEKKKKAEKERLKQNKQVMRDYRINK